MLSPKVCVVLSLCTGGWGSVSWRLGGCLYHVIVTASFMAGPAGALPPGVEPLSTLCTAARDSVVASSGLTGSSVLCLSAVGEGCVVWVELSCSVPF